MIEINQSSAVPIYQQIYENIIKLIMKKVVKEGDKLPSVRELALMVNINPNTIQKAYKQLEEEGYITSQKGKGNYVAFYDDSKRLYKQNLDEQMIGLVTQYLAIGEKGEDICALVKETIKEQMDVKNR